MRVPSPTSTSLRRRLEIRTYLAFVFWAATVVTGFQVIRLIVNGTLPFPYLGRVTLTHFTLLVAGGAMSLIPWAVSARFYVRDRIRDPLRIAALGATLGTFLPYALLNVPYGRVTDPFHRRALEFGEGSLPWIGGCALIVFGAWLTGAKTDRPGIFRRIGLTAAIGWMVLSCLYGREAVHYRSETALGIEASATHRPNVILILVDTLRADHLPVYGYAKPTAPTLTAFAKDATIYERAVAPAPWTRPSCASLFTSRYPLEIGGVSLTGVLSPDLATLPKLMRAEGYATTGIIANHHVSPRFGFGAGFDYLNDGISFMSASGITRALTRLGFLRPDTLFFPAEEVTERAIRWLDSRKGEKSPVFLYLHYIDPHEPYGPEAQPDAWRQFASTEAATLPSAPRTPPWYRGDRRMKSPEYRGRELTPSEREALEAAYDADIRSFDTSFEKLMASLEQHKLLENSILIFVSDHGEEFGDHGHWQHGHTLYRELLHVPFIVRWPESLRAELPPRSNRLVSLVDVIPTLRDVLGTRWDFEFSGKSLLDPVDTGRSDWVFANGRNSRCLYLPPLKLIQYLDKLGNIESEEVFDYLKDFEERQEAPALSPELQEQLEAMRFIMSDLNSRSTGPADSVELDPATLEHLEKLGYL